VGENAGLRKRAAALAFQDSVNLDAALSRLRDGGEMRYKKGLPGCLDCVKE
jgi:hypothetical protein